MRSKSGLGKNELLNWINDCLYSEYQRVEELGDCVAYSLILEALHPRCIQLKKLNFKPETQADFESNNDLFKLAMKKLKYDSSLRLNSLNEGKFSDNLRVLQWIHSKAQDMKVFISKDDMLDKRCRLLKVKKNDPSIQMMFSENLIPNHILMIIRNPLHVPNKVMRGNLKARVQESDRFTELDSELEQIQAEVASQMEFNWKLMYGIQEMSTERDFLYNVLRSVEQVCEQQEDKSAIAKHLLDMIGYCPPEFEEITTEFEMDQRTSERTSSNFKKSEYTSEHQLSSNRTSQDSPDPSEEDRILRKRSTKVMKQTVELVVDNKDAEKKAKKTLKVIKGKSKKKAPIKKKWEPQENNLDIADKILQNLKREFLGDDSPNATPKIPPRYVDSDSSYTENSEISGKDKLMPIQNREDTQNSSEADILQPINKLRSLRNRYYKQK